MFFIIKVLKVLSHPTRLYILFVLIIVFVNFEILIALITLFKSSFISTTSAASIAASVSLIGFIIAGLTKSWLFSFGTALILLIIALIILHKRNSKLYGNE